VRAGETLFGGAILDTRNFRTDLLVKNGQTVVLGGILQREMVDTVRKVPGLGSVPGLGWAFKKKDKVAREVELLVFLRTWVARSPEDAARLLEQVKGKAPLIQQWDAEKDDKSAPPQKNLEENKKTK
jgi:type II secretory pathway component GspD/PulD (secretin)